MKRYILLSAIPIALTSPAKGQDNKPNIIIIYPDDMGYGDLGITGHPDIRTPNLDKMGLNGMRFTNYYSASPASTASRYSLLTGRYPIRSGFRWVLNPDSDKGLHPQELTLAELLKQQGYKTAIFGKWHLGSTKKEYLPLQNGFDEYVGLPYSNDMIPPKYPDIALMEGNDTIMMNPDQSMLTNLYTERAIDFIDRHKSTNFFVYMPYAMPHTPLYPGKDFIGTSKRGLYGDAVEEIDWNVGRLLSFLKENNLDHNTIVWFMSDNGPWLLQKEEGGSAGLFRDGKGSTWEGGVRVPCLVQWPAQLKEMKNETTINSMDVFATCVQLAGGQVPSDRIIDGKSIATILTNKETKDIKEEIPFFYFGIDNKLMAVRTGKWKLHVETYSQLGIEYFGGVTPLLFNLDTDPSEKYNLAETNPDIVEELSNLINDMRKQTTLDGSYWD